jgi:hypothetical protein
MPLPTDFTWLPSTEDAYHNSLEVLPPAAMRAGMFLLGEAMDHDDRGNGYYRAHRHDRTTGTFFVGSRPITGTEFKAL